jgi:putative phosphoesterase
VELGGARFYITHGTPGDPLASQVNIATCPRLDLHSILGGIEADVFVFGHTHIPALRRIDEQVLVNPGSLGQPRYGLPDATYAVWEDGHVQIKHLHYDHAATARKLHLASLSPEVREQLAGILATGLA